MSNNLLLVTADQFSALFKPTEGYRVYSAKGKGEAVVRADEKTVTAFLDLESEKFF
jgi:hypothetical protein